MRCTRHGRDGQSNSRGSDPRSGARPQRLGLSARHSRTVRIDSSPTRVEIVLEVVVVVVRCVLPLLPRRAWHRGVEHRRVL
jgi:hypothetical protein